MALPMMKVLRVAVCIDSWMYGAIGKKPEWTYCLFMFRNVCFIFLSVQLKESWSKEDVVDFRFQLFK